MGKPGDGPALAVIADLDQRQRAVVEAFLAGQRRNAFAEQLQTHLARHPMRTDDGGDPLVEYFRRGSAASHLSRQSIAPARGVRKLNTRTFSREKPVIAKLIYTAR